MSSLIKGFWTGATGFFGRAFLRNLKLEGTAGLEWHFLSRNPTRFKQSWPSLAAVRNTKWHQGDIMTLNDLDVAPLSFVVHAAADSTLAAQLSYLQRFDQILEGTRKVLDFAVVSGAKRLLFVSSGGVYGTQPDDMLAIPESYSGMPDSMTCSNAYGVAKRAAEQLCAIYSQTYGIDIIVARCFAFVGGDLPIDKHFAIGNFIRDALYSREIIVHGDGTAVRSYLDQRDLAAWLLALIRRGKANEAYNVGSDQAISIVELANCVRDLLSPGKPIRILGKVTKNSGRNYYVPDITKISCDLGLQPSYSLKQSILDMAETLSVK